MNLRDILIDQKAVTTPFFDGTEKGVKNSYKRFVYKQIIFNVYNEVSYDGLLSQAPALNGTAAKDLSVEALKNHYELTIDFSNAENFDISVFNRIDIKCEDNEVVKDGIIRLRLKKNPKPDSSKGGDGNPTSPLETGKLGGGISNTVCFFIGVASVVVIGFGLLYTFSKPKKGTSKKHKELKQRG